MRTGTFYLACFALVAYALMTATPAVAQTPEDEVAHVLKTLFDGMRAGDSTAVRSTFDPSMKTLTSTFSRDGQPGSSDTRIDDFVRLVGSPHDAVFNEQIWDVKIQTRGNLASAWMKYAFFLGDKFSHCGVNSFQLKRTDAGWKTIFLADTRQREGCEMPPNMEE